jgi:hypothetical protein
MFATKAVQKNEKEKHLMLEALLPVYAVEQQFTAILTVTIHLPPVAPHQHTLLGPQPERAAQQLSLTSSTPAISARYLIKPPTSYRPRTGGFSM